MTDVHAMVRAERHALAGYLGTLAPADWAQRSWCERWTVEDVVAHLTAAARFSAGRFATGFLRAGLNFGRFLDADLARFRGSSPEETLRAFVVVLDSDRTPPGPPVAALGEVMVHGEDVRRALGTRGTRPEEHLLTLAERYLDMGPPVRTKSRRKGLRLEATDVDFAVGSGPEVRGPVMSLVLAATGRAEALADCDGEGVATLRDRCAGG